MLTGLQWLLLADIIVSTK